MIVQVLQVYTCSLRGLVKGKKTAEPVVLSVDCILHVKGVNMTATEAERGMKDLGVILAVYG